MPNHYHTFKKARVEVTRHLPHSHFGTLISHGSPLVSPHSFSALLEPKSLCRKTEKFCWTHLSKDLFPGFTSELQHQLMSFCLSYPSLFLQYPQLKSVSICKTFQKLLSGAVAAYMNSMGLKYKHTKQKIAKYNNWEKKTKPEFDILYHIPIISLRQSDNAKAYKSSHSGIQGRYKKSYI